MNYTIEKFRCLKPKCADRKPFDSIQALRMHNIRVHTRAGQQGAKKGAKAAAQSRFGPSPNLRRIVEETIARKAKRLPPLLTLDEVPRKIGRKPMDTSRMDPAEAERLRKKREYNAKLRKRYIAQGLTSTGNPRKRGAYAPKQQDVIEASPVKNEIFGPRGRKLVSRCPNCGHHLDPHYVAEGIAAQLDYEEAKMKVTRYEANQQADSSGTT